jgi:hypothetical protein
MLISLVTITIVGFLLFVWWMYKINMLRSWIGWLILTVCVLNAIIQIIGYASRN